MKLTYEQRVLMILFKEVLQQIPQEMAERLVQGYKAGRSITVAITESSGGPTCTTAFACYLTAPSETTIQ